MLNLKTNARKRSKIETDRLFAYFVYFLLINISTNANMFILISSFNIGCLNKYRYTAITLIFDMVIIHSRVNIT